MKKLLPLLFLLVVIAGCRKEDHLSDDFISAPAYSYSGKFVQDYFTLLCHISQSTQGFFPPQVARAYGYVGIANYEAVIHGIAGAQSLAGQLDGFNKSDLPKYLHETEYNWSIASNAALSSIILKMFDQSLSVTNKTAVDSSERSNLQRLSIGVPITVIDRSIQFGKAVADAVFRYSNTDGGQQSYLDPFQLPYNMPSIPSCWVPTSALNTPVSPKWGNNRPFIQANITNAFQFEHASFSTDPASVFYNEAMIVYNQVKNNSPEQIEITKYWADDPFNTCTPTGHTFNIMTQLLNENKATLEKTTVGYAKLCIAENDAFINCWKGKYQFLLIRPVSYIKKYIDPSFNTVIGTPPFPAYTSGHSAEIGAGTKIFTELFTNGDGNYNFTDYSQLQFGFAPRNYTNFNQMAEECANSRLYGGIHYPMDNSAGLKIGRSIGDNVVRNLQWPKNIR